MNYPQVLHKAQALLDQKHYAQAIQVAATVLENLLIELYNDLITQLPPVRQKALVEAQEKIGGGLPLNQLTLGRLLGIYRISGATKDLEKLLGHSLTYFNIHTLDNFVTTRNAVTHEGYEPDAAEAAYLVNQVALILRESNRIQPTSPPMSGGTAGGLSPWWQVAMPHLDIRQGRLDLKVFAVDLAQVIEGEAVSEYRDPDVFFRRTFLTRGLRATLKGVLRRLAGCDDGVAITQMATVFGGGKTHTLLALHHIVTHGATLAYLDPVAQIFSEAELDPSLPPFAGNREGAAAVAAVDCAHISPSHPRVVPGATHSGSASHLMLHTLWGEIAYRLAGAAGYEIVRRSDEERAAPGSEVLQALFAHTGPALILLDETLSYITKASAIPVGRGYLSDQAQEFLLELTRAVNAADNVALVLTMTSSEQEQIGEAAMRAAKEIDTAIRILRRTRQVEVSAEREELYEILKRRLFDTDPAQLAAQARDVAQAYWDTYRAHPNDFPQEVQTPEYRELLVRAYPFHPALIEILRDRWGSIPGFQRTRGVLRLLALVIGDLYRHKHSAPLIQPAHVNLDDGKIRGELLEYVDNKGGYESAILSDIGGTDESKAPYLDRVTGGEYARHSIATGLATAMFMYSHSGAVQRRPAAERPQLWLATLQPGIVPALAADALDKLQQRLWYLDIQENTYRIDNQPNLNQMLVTRVDAIRQEPDTIREKLRETVEQVAGQRPFAHVIFWPAGPGNVPNQRAPTLVVLAPEVTWDQAEATQTRARRFIHDIVNSTGNTFRQLKNTLVFVLATAEGARIMHETAVELLALEAIHRQYRRGGLSETQLDDLNTRLDRARKGLPGAVWGAYIVTVAPTSEANGVGDKTALWIKQEHGFAGYRPGEHSLAGRAWDRLMTEQRLLSRLDPRLITEGKGDQWRVWPAEEDRINVATLWDYFCRFPYLPMLTGPEALQQTIAWGVQRGLFAYALGEGQTFDTIYFRESRSSEEFAIIEGAWLLRPTLAEALIEPPPPPPPPIPPIKLELEGETKGEDEGTGTGPTPPPPPPPRATYHHITIDTPVNWQRWYDFYQAVIKPLVEAGVEVSLQLHVDANGEIDANLVDLSVKESVMQMDARGKVKTEV